MAVLRDQILNTMPTDVRDTYRTLMEDDRASEDEAQRAVDWIERHGPTLGFRPWNNAERVRAIGPAAYLNSLGLSPVQLFNLIGNHFDPRALGHRILQPMFALMQHRQPRWHQFPSPADALAFFEELRIKLLGMHGGQSASRLEELPFPNDLYPAL